MEAPDHRPAKQDVHPGVEDLVPGGHAQVDKQLLLGGSGQLPSRAHGRRAPQHRLGDKDLRGEGCVCVWPERSAGGQAGHQPCPPPVPARATCHPPRSRADFVPEVLCDPGRAA